MQSEAPKESPDEAVKEAPAAPTALTMALLDAHDDALRALSLSDLGTLHVLVVEDDVEQHKLDATIVQDADRPLYRPPRRVDWVAVVPVRWWWRAFSS